MKKLMMSMLASGCVTLTAHADGVGKDKSAPDCSKVIQALQETVKKNAPAAPASADQNGTLPNNSGSAQ
jgi:hypothetical protein